MLSLHCAHRTKSEGAVQVLVLLRMGGLTLANHFTSLVLSFLLRKLGSSLRPAYFTRLL